MLVLLKKIHILNIYLQALRSIRDLGLGGLISYGFGELIPM